VHTPPPTATPKPAAQFEVTIAGDNTGQPQFNPSPVRVYTGTIVVFTNTDTVTRSVVADHGAFSSGPIPPGKSWNYTAATAGTFDYHDGTRPYAVGTVQVVAH
jgi:plastocyanin